MQKYEKQLRQHAATRGLPDPCSHPGKYLADYMELKPTSSVRTANAKKFRSSTGIVHSAIDCGSTRRRIIRHTPFPYFPSRMMFESICGNCVDAEQADHIENRSVLWALNSFHDGHWGEQWWKVAIPALVPQLDQVAAAGSNLSALAGKLAEMGRSVHDEWQQTTATWSRLVTHGITKSAHGRFIGALRGPWYDRRLFGSTDPDMYTGGTYDTTEAFTSFASELTKDTLSRAGRHGGSFRTKLCGQAPASLQVFDHLDVADDERPLSERLTEAWENGLRAECDRMLGNLSAGSPEVKIIYEAKASELRNAFDLPTASALFSITPWTEYDSVRGTLEAVVPASMAHAHMHSHVTGTASNRVKLAGVDGAMSDDVARIAQTLFSESPQSGLEDAVETAQLVLTTA